MIICNSRNFVFIRIPKNASTSLASFFVKGYCEPNDKYTSIGDAGIQNNNIPRHVIQKYSKQHRFIHLTLNEIVLEDLITERELADKKVIGVIRDPYDRQLSLFFFLMKLRGKGNFSPELFRDMMRKGYIDSDSNNVFLQSEYCKLNGIDYGEYWLYDNLETHLDEFVKQKPPHRGQLELPKYKSSLRKNLDKQQLIDQYYDQPTRDVVQKYFEKDFELYEELKSGKN